MQPAHDVRGRFRINTIHDKHVSIDTRTRQENRSRKLRETTILKAVMRFATETSLARPGGNITGVTLYGSELARKRLELLKEAIPGVRRIALLGNTANPFSAFSWNEVQPAGPALGLELRLFAISELGEFPATFAAIKADGADALLVLSDASFNAARREIIKLAVQHHLPTMFEAREFVEDGGLMAYGPNIAEMTRRSASLIVKVLKGANPGDLPIEQPTTFELIINVQTGNALGITFPTTVLTRADKVIE